MGKHQPNGLAEGKTVYILQVGVTILTRNMLQVLPLVQLL